MVVKLISPKQLFVIAIKNGIEVHVDTFQPGVGLSCGCTCPKCGKPVVSNVSIRTDLKRKFTNHFSHHDLSLDSICSGIVEERVSVPKTIKSSSTDLPLWVILFGGSFLIFINRKRIMRFFGWY